MDIRLASGEDIDVYTKSGGIFRLPDVAANEEQTALNSTAVAAAFDSATEYAIDDLVTCNGSLYRCVSAISTPSSKTPPEDLYDDSGEEPIGHWIEDNINSIIGNVEAILHVINNGASTSENEATA